MSFSKNFKAPQPNNFSSSHKLQNLIDESFNPGISKTCALPSGDAALSSIKCFVKSSLTSGCQNFPQ